MKKTAKERRQDKEFAYQCEIKKMILFPGFDNRVSLEVLLKTLEPKFIITSRRCSGTKKRKDKNTGKFAEIKTYKIFRYFVEFKDGQRISLAPNVFRWLKTEEKIHHKFENYII